MISIKQLRFSYSGVPPYILNDINVEIPKGKYISIIGENGSGKTTLMRLLLGSLKPSQGSIVMQSRFKGYVPQRNDFSNIDFPITVYEVLYSYLKLIKCKDKDMINRVLSITGMDQYKNRLMGKLSGGQVQKVLIARALMGKPDLLILDEPSTGVDVESQKDIYGLLKKMSVEEEITIVAVEHNLSAAFKNSDYIFHLQNGHGHLCSANKFTSESLFGLNKEE